MGLREELLAETGPQTHIAGICGRAADELLIKEMKIEQQEREIERLRGWLKKMDDLPASECEQLWGMIDSAIDDEPVR